MAGRLRRIERKYRFLRTKKTKKTSPFVGHTLRYRFTYLYVYKTRASFIQPGIHRIKLLRSNPLL